MPKAVIEENIGRIEDLREAIAQQGRLSWKQTLEDEALLRPEVELLDRLDAYTSSFSDLVVKAIPVRARAVPGLADRVTYEMKLLVLFLAFPLILMRLFSILKLHVASSRYPESDSEGPSHYTSDKPLVRYCPEIVKHLTQIIKLLEEIPRL